MNNTNPASLATLATVATALQSITLGSVQSAFNLAVVPLLRSAAPPPDYLTLDLALAKGLVEVTEISESGSVPELFFRNRSGHKVLLVDGEELVGARQNRVLNLSVLAAPGMDLKIPVSCVEQGRWSYRSRAFRSEGRALHARARADKMAAVSESLRSFHEPRSNQGALWQEISRKSAAMEVRSDTDAMSAIYDNHREKLTDYRRAFRAVEGQVGAAFVVGDRLLGLEVFDAPSTLEALLPKLADSYSMDALEDLKPRQDLKECIAEEHYRRYFDDLVKAFIERLLLGKPEMYPGVGIGTTVRLEGPSLRAGALVDGERMVHLSAHVA